MESPDQPVFVKIEAQIIDEDACAGEAILPDFGEDESPWHTMPADASSPPQSNPNCPPDKSGVNSKKRTLFGKYSAQPKSDKVRLSAVIVKKKSKETSNNTFKDAGHSGSNQLSTQSLVEEILNQKPVVCLRRIDNNTGGKAFLAPSSLNRDEENCQNFRNVSIKEEDEESLNGNLEEETHLDDISSELLLYEDTSKKITKTSKNITKPRKKPLSASSSNAELFPCPLCPSKFKSKSTLWTHKKRSHENISRPFSCSQCSGTFISQYTLDHHLAAHSNEKQFSCPHCPTRFKYKANLQSHMRSYPDENHVPENMIKRFSCSQCSSSFGWKSHLKVHIRAKHSKERPYSCTKCSAKFERLAKLKRHLAVHSVDRPYTCAHCSASFRWKESLKRHLLYPPDGNHPAVDGGLREKKEKKTSKKFQCDLCKGWFLTSSDLNDHIRSKHDKTLPFPCVECSVRFPNYSSLKCHLLSHSNEKLFFCSHCPARFKYEGGLKRHLSCYRDENHHPSNKSYRYACTFCSRRFSLNTHLNYHIRVKHREEKSYACNRCSAKFVTKAEIKIHSLEHGKGKLLYCAHCTARYRTKKALKQHLKSHSVEKNVSESANK